MSDTSDGEGHRPIPVDEDGPPGTSRNPTTGVLRDRRQIGRVNQHDLREETPDTDDTDE